MKPPSQKSIYMKTFCPSSTVYLWEVYDKAVPNVATAVKSKVERYTDIQTRIDPVMAKAADHNHSRLTSTSPQLHHHQQIPASHRMNCSPSIIFHPPSSSVVVAVVVVAVVVVVVVIVLP